MASKRNSNFPQLLDPRTLEKENQHFPAAKVQVESQASLSWHQHLERRSTCPDVASSQVNFLHKKPDN
jgi:hypothetical protein